MIYAGIGIAAFLSGIAFHKHFSDAKIAKIDAQHAEYVASAEKAKAEAEREQRRMDGKRQDNVDKARKEKDDALAIQSRVNARLRADVDGLHDSIATYARANPLTDTLAACVDRAGRLGRLVESGGDLVAGSSDAAQKRYIKLKACVDGWPSLAAGALEPGGAAESAAKTQ